MEKENSLNKYNKKIEMLQLILRNQINLNELNKFRSKEFFKLINDMNSSNIDKTQEYKTKNKILLEKIFRLAEKIKELQSK